jgi:signal transduction histidine kinase
LPTPLLEEEAARVLASADVSQKPDQDLFSSQDYRMLLATLAHDLKNPLTRIRARAQLLQRRIQQPEGLDRSQLSEALAQIEAATTRMNTLLDEVVALSAKNDLGTGLSRESVDLVGVVRYLAQQYQQASERHQIRVRAPQGDVVGRWDRLRVERIVSNLLSNAVKYSPDGGEVLVSVWIEGDASGRQRWAILDVRDQGIGIPADDLPHLFKQRYRARNALGRAAGTGLGLAAVAHMVNELGGTVGVESEERRGSTFSVRLPLGGVSGDPRRRDELRQGRDADVCQVIAGSP